MRRKPGKRWYGGWDTKIASCIPIPIKINPLDGPEELQKQIIEILSEAIKRKSQKMRMVG